MITPTDGAASDYFGVSVAIDGTKIVASYIMMIMAMIQVQYMSSMVLAVVQQIQKT